MSQKKSKRAIGDNTSGDIHQRRDLPSSSPHVPLRLEDSLRRGRREKGRRFIRSSTLPHAQRQQPVLLAQRYSLYQRGESCLDIEVGEDSSCHVRIGRGASILQLLLQNKGTSFPCLEIVRLTAFPVSDLLTYPEIGDSSLTISGLGDAGEILDEQAKVEYRERIRKVRADLEAAIRGKDEICAREAEEELKFLTHEITSAEALGKRGRRMASASERARVSVQKAISNAIDKIEKKLLDLGLHLRKSIKTGTFCVYSPTRDDSTHCEFY